MSAKLPTHLFLIDPETFDSLDQTEIDATVADLKALDLYHLPYPRVSIRLPTDKCSTMTQHPSHDPRFWVIDAEGKAHTNLGPEHWTQFDNVNLLGEPYTLSFVCDGVPHWRPYNILVDAANTNYMRALCDALIVLLATKNAVKTTVHNKLARLGIGRKKAVNRFDYVTTISLPGHMEADHDHPATGATVAPHLRRGHIRRQHYGPEMAFVKMIWIAPVFVNADPDFVSTRARYNLGGRAPRTHKKESV